MKRPPETLDGSHVLYFADLTGVEPSGRTEHFVDDVRVGGFAGLAIARYDGSEYLLFYCNEDWTVINDAAFRSPWLCVAQAQWEYEQVEFEAVEPLPPDIPPSPTEFLFRAMTVNRRMTVGD